MSTRRSFFGQVLGGLAVALGVKAAPLVFHPDAFKIATEGLSKIDAYLYEKTYREVYGTVGAPSDWVTATPTYLKRGDVITIRGVWDVPHVITSDVTASR